MLPVIGICGTINGSGTEWRQYVHDVPVILASVGPKVKHVGELLLAIFCARKCDKDLQFCLL